MNERDLFGKRDEFTEIELIYSSEKRVMSARLLGESILGMELCLRETANVSSFIFDDIVVYPTELGSIKTKFAYVKRHPWTILVGLDLIVNLIHNSFGLIQDFGLSNAYSPSPEILKNIQDGNIIKLCRNRKFIEGAQHIVSPLSEDFERLEISYGNKTIDIKCDNRDKFFEDIGDKIFPELKDGETVQIEGEITRINKVNNDLGFKYKDKVLEIRPLEGKNTVDYHNYLTMKKVMLTGIVIRTSFYEIPRIIVKQIDNIERNQLELFSDSK